MTGNNEVHIRFLKERGVKKKYCYYVYFQNRLTVKEFIDIWNRV